MIAAFVFVEWIIAVYVLGHTTRQYYQPVDTTQDILDRGLTPIISNHLIGQMRKSSLPLFRELADIAGAVIFYRNNFFAAAAAQSWSYYMYVKLITRS